MRIVSIRPGKALHYIKKLKSSRYIDLPSAFWQAHYQLYDKIFILDECTFPYSYVLKDIIEPQTDPLKLNDVIIMQQKCHYMRIFGMLNDKAMMIVTHKPVEEYEQTVIQEVVTLSAAAQNKYEEYYSSSKTAILNQATAND